MNKNKRIFVIFVVIFILILIYIGYDFSTRTTFPGRKNTNEEKQHIEENNGNKENNESDVPADSIMMLENT